MAEADRRIVKPTRRLFRLPRPRPSLLDGKHVGNYKLLRTIGEGKCSKVMIARHEDTGEQVAVKVINKGSFSSEVLEILSREANIMQSLNHPNIIKYIEVIETYTNICLVMEYAPGGDLFDYLEKHGCLTEKEARVMLRQIFSAVEYCHRKKIIHRDINEGNILLDGQQNIKLIDFGLSTEFTSENRLQILCGSLPYIAPELFRGERYGPKVDVWSLGILLHVLLTKSVPFDGSTKGVKGHLLVGSFKLPHFLSADCKKLLKGMIALEPDKRPEVRDIMQGNWINYGYEEELKPYAESP